MVYDIDPVKATLNKYKHKNCGINNLNNTCYGICSAFGNTQSNWTVDGNCANSCKELIESRKRHLYRGVSGDNMCNWKAPRVPPYFGRVPNYFPHLLNQYGNVEQAKKECHQMCKNNSRGVPNECKDWCDTLADAVVDINTGVESYDNDDNGPDYGKYEKAHPWSFYIAFIVTGIILSLVIAIALMVIFSKK